MFPETFKFGWSQAGFQSEMGVSGSEDPNSDWFVWVHDRENILSGLVSGDLPEFGPGYWNNFENFHLNAVRMGLKIARIGIEWSRIFPKPMPKPLNVELKGEDVISVEVDENDLRKLDYKANVEAINHYRRMFSDLKSHGIDLILNLYHWSLPLWLHDPIRVRRGEIIGEHTGWLNINTIIQFAIYAAYVAWKMDDLVEAYTTMNEPNVVYNNGYVFVKSGFPPSYLSVSLSKKVMYNLIQAHARAYNAIKSVTKKPVGIIHANRSITPHTEHDIEAVEEAENVLKWNFFDAIIKGKIKEVIREDLRGKLDFIGVNYYTRIVVRKTKEGFEPVKGYGPLCKENSFSLDGRPTSDFGWEIYPEGLYDVLIKYWKRYKIPMYVTENGIADAKDQLRSYYLVSHIKQVEKAIEEGADIRGYLHWSLADNYEWASGFSKRFGLLEVDYITKKLYWRPSAYICKEIAENNKIPHELEYLTKILNKRN